MKNGKKTPATGRDAPRRTWSERLRDVRLPLLVCALAFFVYTRSLRCGFLRDDMPQIVHNRQVQSWAYLPRLLGSHLWSQTSVEWPALFYRPIFSVWMLIVHTFGGLAPWFWHLSNILLHVVASYLVFRFCQRLTQCDAAAAAGAAIFAVYPSHVDAVTWVSASCEILFAIFVLASMLALLSRADEKANPRIWVSALWFAAGLYAKETAIALLPVLIVFAWLRLKGSAQGAERLWKAAGPYGTVTAIYLLTRWAVMGRMGVESGEHTWAEVGFSAPSIFLFYMKKLFLPWNLSACYQNPLTSTPTTGFWLALLVITLTLSAVAWLALRNRSLVGLAAALIVFPVLPALAVTRVYPQGDMTHDRYLYVSTVGVALLAAILVNRLWALGKSAQVAVTAVVIVLMAAAAVETVFVQRYYQDDFAFCSRVLEMSPTNASVRAMLGDIYLDENRVDLALEQLQEAHQTAPGDQKITLFLARGLFVAERYPEAETMLNGLLQTPSLSVRRRKSTLLSLANVKMATGKLDDAQQLLQQIDQSDDGFPELHWAWGVLYQKRGMLPQALAEYEKEVQITGDALAQQRSAQVARLIYRQTMRNGAANTGP